MQEDCGRSVAEAAVAYLAPIGSFDDPWRKIWRHGVRPASANLS